MRHTRDILIGAAAALMTFGALTLSFGSHHASWHGRFHHGHHGHHAGDSCRVDSGWHGDVHRGER